MKNKCLVILLMLLVSSYSFSQTYTMGTDTGIQTTCSGTFVDSGGAGTNNPTRYSNSESGNAITFCPSTPGDLIQVSFTQFETEAIGATLYDYLEYWNANSNAGAADGVYGGSLGAFTHTSTSPDGCVTFEFTSDFSNVDLGWEATISCITPCSPPTAALVDTTTLDICNPNATNPGSLTVAFDASASTAVGPASVVSYEWVFGDGTTATTATPTTSHTYPATSEIYIASVSVRDDNTSSDPLGCRSTNATSKIIRVLPEPDFSSTPASYNINCGDTATLTGIVSSQTETQATPAVVGSTISLPDGSGASYSSSLDFTGYFPVGATMAPGCYPTITFDLEHSFSGDLEIELIAPTGETLMMYDEHGGGTGFGNCVNGADDLVPGCSATYTVVPTGGTAWTAATQLTAPPTVNGTCVYTGTCETGNYYDPAINYSSTNAFSVLDGADLNGSWTIKITDNLTFDDGIIDTWSISFPSACYATLETVTPDLVSATWTGGPPALPGQSTTSAAVVDPGPDACPTPGTCTGTQLTNSPVVGPFATPGSTTYTLTVVDEFGCEFTKDVTVTATCSCILTLDVAGTDTQTLCENTAITDITYTVGGDATGATVTGLPAGVTGTYAAGTFTISGTPTANGVFNYSVTTVGCTPNLTENGTITVNAVPAVPTINTVAPTCAADGNSTVTNYNAALTYTFTPAGPTVGAGGAISGMTLGTSYTVTAGNGSCTSVASASFTNLAMLVTPAVPTVNSVAPTCAADGNSTVTNYNAALTYTFTPAGPTVGAGGAISGMTLGTAYTVTAGNGSCTSVASASFTNLAMLVTPVVPTINTVAPTCAADGNSTVTNYNAALTYTFTPAGPTVGAGGAISGMTLGTSYTVTAGNGSCTSVASVSFTNLAMLVTPAVPTINTVVPTCAADGNSTVTNYNAALTYTFTPAGPTVGAGGAISGMTLGMAYTVTAGNGSCTSVASASFTNLAMLVTPAVPTINTVPPTCVADGNSTVTNYNAALTYTFTPAGPTVGAGGAISGMTLGTAYTVTAGNGSCTSVASASFTNLAMLPAQPAPTINTVAPTCAADGNSTVTNYNAAITYTFTPAGPTVGAGGAISGMTLGTSYTVTATVGICVSVSSASFTNLAMLVTPAVPTINTVAPTCAADGNSTVTNYNATLTYTFTPAGPTVGAGGTISGMTLGTAYTVTAGNGSCTSVASASFTNLAMLVTPAVPTVNTVAPTCAADGNSTVTNYNAALTYTFTPAGPTVGAGGAISGMTLGTAYTVTAGNGSCTSVASASFTNLAMLVTPAVPTINTVAPTCAADGNSTVTNYNAALTYTFTPAGPTVGAGGAISGMTLGTAYTVTAGNGSCTSVASVSFTNLAMLVTPAVPTINTVVPTCAADGNSTVTNYNAALTYTFTPAGPTVGAGGAISGMTLGTSYTVIAGNGSCTSVTSASFTNLAMLEIGRASCRERVCMFV